MTAAGAAGQADASAADATALHAEEHLRSARGGSHRSPTRTADDKPDTTCAPVTNDQGELIFIFTAGDATMKVTNDLSSLSAAREAIIMIGGQLYMDEQTTSPGGNKLFMQERFGSAFFTGLQELDLEIDDGIVSGSINGQQLVPEPVSSQTVELASGAPLPTWSSTPSADAEAQAVHAAAVACLDPPPIDAASCLTDIHRCLPRVPPPDGGTDSGTQSDAGQQPQNVHPGGGGTCSLIGYYDIAGCKNQEELCLGNPPDCAGDVSPLECLKAIIANRKICMQNYESCIASVGTLTMGQTCDAALCGACCDGSACEALSAGGSTNCCVPFTPFTSSTAPVCGPFTAPTVGLPTCIVGQDDTCCPDGMPGSTRSCVQQGTSHVCLGNAGACCTPGGNDCAAGTVCQGPGVYGNGQTDGVTCGATCCTPGHCGNVLARCYGNSTGASCGDGDPACVYDNTCTNTQEELLTQDRVRGGGTALPKMTVDDRIFAQPLFLSSVAINQGPPRSVVYVATMNNTLYAFDAYDSSPSPQPLPPFPVAEGLGYAPVRSDQIGNNPVNSTACSNHPFQGGRRVGPSDPYRTV